MASHFYLTSLYNYVSFVCSDRKRIKKWPIVPGQLFQLFLNVDYTRCTDRGNYLKF